MSRPAQDRQGTATARLLFVVGVGRSGTTLVQAILNAHPEVISVPESHFVRKHVVPDVYRLPDATLDLVDVAERLEGCQDFARLQVDVRKLLERYRGREGTFGYADLFRTALEAYADQQGAKHARYIVDKDPSNTGYVSEIYSEFPSARLLHVVRDPVDVLYSRTTTEWGRRRSFLRHVGTYMYQVRAARWYGKSLFGRRYREIRYEDLAGNARDVCRNMCDWMGLEYDDRMLSFQEDARSIVSGDEVAWKKQVFRPLSTASIGKGDANLTGWRAAWAEAVSEEVGGTRADGGNRSKEFWRRLARAAGSMARLRYLLQRLARRIRGAGARIGMRP